jgi:hypothetical protein
VCVSQRECVRALKSKERSEKEFWGGRQKKKEERRKFFNNSFFAKTEEEKRKKAKRAEKTLPLFFKIKSALNQKNEHKS